LTIISAPRLLVDGVLTGPGAVVLEDGVIADVLDRLPASGPDHVELRDGLLTPGLVDLQVNGAYGVDLVRANAQEWELVARQLPRTGVTAFLPTFITAPVADLAAALERTAAARDLLAGTGSARILGAHLEGPFLSPLQAGAHDPALMVDPTDDRLDVILDGEDERDVLRVVTIAPERAHALPAIRRLTAAGVVVSVGHTDATGAQTAAAADAGARMVTHLFNAQRGLRHREPGVPGYSLSDDRFTLGLIADLHHVDAPIVHVVFRAAGGRVALVTDAIAAAGMPPGRYELGGVEVVVEPGDRMPRRADGTIAGSSLRLDAAVRNVVEVGVEPAVALLAATRVPADVLGRTDLGRLAAGACADLVWWDDDFLPHRTWVGGVEVGGRRTVTAAGQVPAVG
jgi:N-acetylglucosamine-6-phosphate deacetylase